MNGLFQIEERHFTAGLEVKDKVVVKAAPIVCWTVGHTIGEVITYYRLKGIKVCQVSEVSTMETASRDCSTTAREKETSPGADGATNTN